MKSTIKGSRETKPQQLTALVDSALFDSDEVKNITLFNAIEGTPTTMTTMTPLGNGPVEYTYLVRLSEGKSSEFMEKAKKITGVVHVQPNFKYKAFGPSAMSTDAIYEPDYDDHQKAAFELMGFPNAWSYSAGAGVRVAVLDSGIKIKHQEFCGDPNEVNVDTNNQTLDVSNCTKVVAPYDFVHDPPIFSFQKINGVDYYDEDTLPEDYGGHGSHVAGIIASKKNGKGMVGAAYEAEIMPIRVMYPRYTGVSNTYETVGDTDDIVQGINYAVTNNADIINMSLGAALSNSSDLIFRTAVDNATAAGVLVIAASGNDNINMDTNKIAPAYFENAMAVGSVADNGEMSSRTNFGDTLDVVAVGSDVYSVGVATNSAYGQSSGTSMAAPFVSALAAIAQSYYKSKNNGQRLSPAELRRVIQLSATSDSDSPTLHKGHGIINAKQALFMLGVSDLNNAETDVYMGSDGSRDQLLCFPNPFDWSQASSIGCEFYLNQPGNIHWAIYSRRGRVVASGAFNGNQGLNKQLSWDGRDRSGHRVPVGVYQLVATIEVDGKLPITRKHLLTMLR
ncbi:MAG: S8 family serine peptidase [Candidatus Margulisbacteria bacterium]|nr:S8 family serine peptidase [Candidatus Margulisiibacteriota bacterium]